MKKKRTALLALALVFCMLFTGCASMSKLTGEMSEGDDPDATPEEQSTPEPEVDPDQTPEPEQMPEQTPDQTPEPEPEPTVTPADGEGPENPDITEPQNTGSAYGVIIEKDGVMQLGDFDNLIDGHIVYYPIDLESSDRTYPVAVWANGTMCAPILYYKLLVGVAKLGYIVIASPELMSKDGTDQINAIDYISAENEDSDSPFYGKVDTGKIGAFGHSQGGLSCVNAAVADSRIGAIVSIAGASEKSQTANLSVPTLFLTGTLDTIVLSSVWVKPSYEGCPAPAVYASLKGGIHTSCIAKADTYINYIVKWFDAWLYTDGSKSAFMDGGELSQDGAWTGFRAKNFPSDS